MVEVYKSQESGHLDKLSLKNLQKGSWINIIDPTPYELREVSALTQVEPDFLRAALAPLSEFVVEAVPIAVTIR